ARRKAKRIAPGVSAMRWPEGGCLLGLRRPRAPYPNAPRVFPPLSVGLPRRDAFLHQAPRTGEPVRRILPHFATEVCHADPRCRPALRLGPVEDHATPVTIRDSSAPSPTANCSTASAPPAARAATTTSSPGCGASSC